MTRRTPSGRIDLLCGLRPGDIVYVTPGKDRRLARITMTKKGMASLLAAENGLLITYLDNGRTAWIYPIQLTRVPPLVALALQADTE